MGRNIEFIEEDAIQKAMSIFWEKGYNGTSMRDLAEAMQVNSSSLYRSIGNKQQLFLKCIDTYAHIKMIAILNNIKTIESPIKTITYLINTTAHIIISSENSCMSIKTTFELGSDNTAVLNILQKHYLTYYNMLAGLVRNAMGKGEMNANEEPEIVAEFILNVFTGWHESFIINSDPVKIKKMAQYLINKITL
jgi:TetR/AcrR family transcriptional repressor of nem operon